MGGWCSSWPPSSAWLNHLPRCGPMPAAGAAASLRSHQPSQRLSSGMRGAEMSTWLGNKEKQTALEPGNLQECRAAVLLSQLQTCFARGSSLCRVEGMRRVLPSRTSVLQTNGKPLSHQQSRPGNGQAARVTRKLCSFLLTERGGGRTQVIIRATHSNFGEASAHGSGSSCKCCQFSICVDWARPETQWQAPADTSPACLEFSSALSHLGARRGKRTAMGIPV